MFVSYTVGSRETTGRVVRGPCTFTASSCYKRVKFPGLRQAAEIPKELVDQTTGQGISQEGLS